MNAAANGEILERIAVLSADAQDLLNKSMERVRLSARGYYRVLRVARTIADLASVKSGQVSDNIEKTHIAEALSYRRIANF